MFVAQTKIHFHIHIAYCIALGKFDVHLNRKFPISHQLGLTHCLTRTPTHTQTPTHLNIRVMHAMLIPNLNIYI